MKQRYRIIWVRGSRGFGESTPLIFALNKAAYLFAKNEGYLVGTFEKVDLI